MGKSGNKNNYFLYLLEDMHMAEEKSLRRPKSLVPEVDETMENTGYDCCLCLESGEYARAHFLVKEAETISPNLLRYMCGLVEGGWKAVCDSNKGRIQEFLCDVRKSNSCVAGGVTLEVSGLNCDTVTIALSVSPLSGEVYTLEKKYTIDDFRHGNVDKIFSAVPDVASQMLKENSGVKVNKLWLYYLCSIDIDHSYVKAKDYPRRIFKGISREFFNVWFVPDDPFPVTEDTYILGLFICEDWDKNNVRESVKNAKAQRKGNGKNKNKRVVSNQLRLGDEIVGYRVDIFFCGTRVISFDFAKDLYWTFTFLIRNIIGVFPFSGTVIDGQLHDGVFTAGDETNVIEVDSVEKVKEIIYKYYVNVDKL